MDVSLAAAHLSFACCGGGSNPDQSDYYKLRRKRAEDVFEKLHLPRTEEELQSKLETGGDTGVDVAFDKWHDRPELKITARWNEPEYPGVVMSAMKKAQSDVAFNYSKTQDLVEFDAISPYVQLQCQSCDYKAYASLSGVYLLGLNSTTLAALLAQFGRELDCKTHPGPDSSITVVEFEPCAGPLTIVAPPSTILARLVLRRKGNTDTLQLAFILERMNPIETGLNAVKREIKLQDAAALRQQPHLTSTAE